MKISIITPTFNSQETIEDNINSVINQEYDNWEQIIVDNLSEDKTLNIVSKFQNNKISVISENDKPIKPNLYGKSKFICVEFKKTLKCLI